MRSILHWNSITNVQNVSVVNSDWRSEMNIHCVQSMLVQISLYEKNYVKARKKFQDI